MLLSCSLEILIPWRAEKRRRIELLSTRNSHGDAAILRFAPDSHCESTETLKTSNQSVKGDANAALLRLFAAVIFCLWRPLKCEDCREEESNGCCRKTNKQQPPHHEPTYACKAAGGCTAAQQGGLQHATNSEDGWRAYKRIFETKDKNGSNFMNFLESLSRLGVARSRRRRRDPDVITPLPVPSLVVVTVAPWP